MSRLNYIFGRAIFSRSGSLTTFVLSDEANTINLPSHGDRALLFCLFFLMLYVLVNNCSVMQGRFNIFLG